MGGPSFDLLLNLSRSGCRTQERFAHQSRTRGLALEDMPGREPDGLPDFPYHRLRMESYVRSTFMGKRTLPHHSSYGCPFTCNFCAVVNWRPAGGVRNPPSTPPG